MYFNSECYNSQQALAKDSFSDLHEGQPDRKVRASGGIFNFLDDL